MSESGEGIEISTKAMQMKTSSQEKPASLHAELHHSSIEDKLGDPYSVDYARVTDEKDLLATPEGEKIFADILKLLPQTFPDITLENAKTRFFGLNGIDIVKAENGEAVAFHAYKFRELQGTEKPVKVMYTYYAGVSSAYTGRRLTELSRLPVVDIEQPEVIAGSTAVPAIMLSNERIAESRGYTIYPQDPNPPAEVVDLARQVFNTILKPPAEGTEHPVSSHLTRTRDNVVRQDGENQLPFFDEVMQLKPNEQVFYMLVKNNSSATTPSQSTQV